MIQIYKQKKNGNAFFLSFFFKIWNLTFSIGSSSSNIVLMIISYIVEARIVENFVFVFCSCKP